MKSEKAPSITILLIMIIMTIISSNLHWRKDNWKGVLEADAKGYYAYLPAVFIYHDLHFNFFDKIEKEKYYNENLFFEYRAHVNDTTINKFFCGTAIMQFPFFAVAHLLSPVFHHEQDGYSAFYMIAICIAALFYLFTGLFFINKILAIFNIEPVARSIVLVVVVFATNVFYYSEVEAGMSHIYSFAAISVFIYCTRKFFMNFKYKYLMIASLAAGLIILLRPVNGMIMLIIPFLSGSPQTLKQGFTKLTENGVVSASGILIFLSVIFIQLLIYKITVGSFFVYSYEHEGFRFSDPHFMDILFSYKKGLFLYTPALFLSLTGFYFIYRRSKFEFYSLLLFFVALNYVLSSWWNWWYGGSFSSRVYLEFIPVFAILMGIAIASFQNLKIKGMFISLLFLCVVLCQIQTYQYRYYQIHWENMTREKYRDVFLRIDKLVK